MTSSNKSSIPHNNQIRYHHSFEDMQKAAFDGLVNAHCWQRQLSGDFTAIVQAFGKDEDLVEIDKDDLSALHLNGEGLVAKEIILEDLQRLELIGAQPSLNVIRRYARDMKYDFFPTDVYSFHVDRAPLPIATYLCTYVGAASDILPNHQAIQKTQVPSIREGLKQTYTGRASDFEDYLRDYFFDLHYEALAGADIINCGKGHLWRLAVDCAGSGVLPCIHRAPHEINGEPRLLLIS